MAEGVSGDDEGTPPLMAIAGAQEIACRRGVVLDKTVIQRSPYDFILFIAGCTVFVRVKRIRTHISNPQEIARMFCEEIQQLRTVLKNSRCIPGDLGSLPLENVAVFPNIR